MRYSYSKLAQFDDCPRSFYLEHVLGYEPTNNFYAEYGSLMHDILRKMLIGELDTSQALSEYSSRFDTDIKSPFPPSLDDATTEYYCSGLDYLWNFKSVIPEPHKIVQVEKKIVSTLFGYDFSYIIDLLVEDEGGNLILIDHKSSSPTNFYGKSGRKKFRQLYIYSEFVKQAFGKYPTELVFNCFRAGKLIRRPFDPEELDETMSWAEETIKDIESMYHFNGRNEKAWPMDQQVNFFCNNVCGVSELCERNLGF